VACRLSSANTLLALDIHLDKELSCGVRHGSKGATPNQQIGEWVQLPQTPQGQAQERRNNMEWYIVWAAFIMGVVAGHLLDCIVANIRRR